LEAGEAELHVGNYSEAREQRRRAAERRTRAAAAKTQAARAVADAEKHKRQAQRDAERDSKRARQALERRLPALEGEIARLESEHQAVRTELAEEHGGDWQRLHALVEQEAALGERLRAKMGEWEELGRSLGLGGLREM